MTIRVNGETHEIPDGFAVRDLLAHLRLPAERVAVERNREILPRTLWSTTSVEPGDSYEIVQFVGGG